MTATIRILIVEDEKLIAFDLSRRLPRLGYEVCGLAATGEEAIAEATRLKPDLVLMDICLRGDMDGIVAAETIRQTYDCPIIFLTANSDEMTLKRAKLTRPSSYVIKPFKERELQISIDLALVNHGLQSELRAARDQLELRVAERTSELGRVNGELRAEVELRKKNEAEARERANLLAQARDAIYVRDLTGVITYWNRSAERLYEVPATEALGRQGAALLGEESCENSGLAERATLQTGEWMGELRHRNRSGQDLIVESRWTLVRDESGQPQLFLVVNTDITERKRTAEQLLRAQRLESVGALASGIAHDLNNVFAPVLMAADLLLDAPERERERMIEMLRTSAHRGAEMVKQVLMFVRGGDGAMEPTALDFLATEVCKLMRETLPCTIRLTERVSPQAQMILGDPTQLHQVLMNLCVNARDAMPDGGELRVQIDNVSVTEPRSGELGELAPGKYVRLTVADTGTGMPPEVRKKIFDPFFTTKEVGKGTGLGLSTVAAIIRHHGGFLEVETEVGRGTRFLIYLPVCEQEGRMGPLLAEAMPTGSGETLMIVDDDHAIREIARLTLEARNYRVVLANDGAEALSVFLQHRGQVALVLTDIMMPVMHGRALIHALRRLAPELPIVAFSAGERAHPLVASLAEENVAFLPKPATSRQMLVAVADGLKGRGRPAAPEGVGENAEVGLGI